MTDLSLIEMHSALVAMTVEQAIDHASTSTLGKERNNCIIGWSHCREHPGREDAISMADAATLLAILWDDRELFLRAMSNTLSPGLSPIVYVLWRYVIYERHLQGSSIPQSRMLMIPFVEIFWRSFLSIGPEGRRPFQLLNAVNYQDAQIWEDSPKHSRLDDSLQIMRALTKQLRQTDPVLKCPDINDALNYVYQHSLLGCEIELPALIQATIHQLWDDFFFAISQDVEDKISIMNNICTCFVRIAEMLKPLTTRPAELHTAKLIVDTVVENRLLDLVGRMLLSMKPSVTELFPGGADESTRNGSLFHASDAMFNILSRLGPKLVIIECFKPYEADWWKFLQHLQFLKQMNIGPLNSSAFYSLAIEVWKSIWESLGYSSLIRQLFVCTYGRCAKPNIRIGVEYVCGRCREKVYCTRRCQVLDWGSGSNGDGSCGHLPSDPHQLSGSAAHWDQEYF